MKTKAKSRASKPASKSPAKGELPADHWIIVIGIDKSGTPKAGRFTLRQGDIAATAASGLDFAVFEAASETMIAAAKKLPMGRLYAQGRAFIPAIKRDLYNEIVECRRLEGGQGLNGLDIQANGQADDNHPARGLPKSWDDLAPGHLVLVHAGLPDGWWESIVLARNGDTLKLRWRDYPKYKPFDQNIREVALINPGPASPTS